MERMNKRPNVYLKAFLLTARRKSVRVAAEVSAPCLELLPKETMEVVVATKKKKKRNTKEHFRVSLLHSAPLSSSARVKSFCSAFSFFLQLFPRCVNMNMEGSFRMGFFLGGGGGLELLTSEVADYFLQDNNDPI